jgi:hypothetical protein
VHLTLGTPEFTKDVPTKKETDGQFIKGRLEQMVEVFSEVRRRQRQSAERNQARLNVKRILSDHFKEGEQVLYYGPMERDAADNINVQEHVNTAGTHRKWLNKCSGPHTIVGKGDFETIKIFHARRKRVERGFHVKGRCEGSRCR